MSRFLTTRTRRTMLAWLAAMLLVAAAVPVGAAGPPGNNGTVKIHSGAEGSEPSPEIKNEPHVGCPFHVHFYFADTDQQGDWVIAPQAPGAAGLGTNGSYNTGPETSVSTGDIILEAGHYKLYWQGRGEKNVKHKTFWVEGECDGGGGGIG
ncbi:MAG: hypothetical protein M3P32_01415 [Chloroflexota bacterium]|nr:hypothetical protein [Chloroflexota bacterium]